MIAGIFHEGSGLGDQLFRYITVRTVAEKKGFDFTMVNPENFKGISFIRDLLPLPSLRHGYSLWEEKDIRAGEGIDVRSYDPEINFVEDNTLIDGSFEDDKYWRHNLNHIDQWLMVDSLMTSDKRCIIGFRGGEYASYPDLFLPKAFYRKAIEKMLEIDPNMEFEVHTDDPILALTYFPEFPIVDNHLISHSKHSNMGYNWRTARYAKYAIIPNSAFFIIPRILKHLHDKQAVTIAPRYWAGHNTRTWKRPATYYPEFTYIHASDIQ